MKRRKEIMSEIENFENDELNDLIKDYIDDLEFEINNAIDFLDDIKGPSDLERVGECYDFLKSLSRDLY